MNPDSAIHCYTFVCRSDILLFSDVSPDFCVYLGSIYLFSRLVTISTSIPVFVLTGYNYAVDRWKLSAIVLKLHLSQLPPVLYIYLLHFIHLGKQLLTTDVDSCSITFDHRKFILLPAEKFVVIFNFSVF